MENTNVVQHKLNPDKWISNYGDYLLNYTVVRVDGREIAKDLVQETFFAALKSMKNFKGQASERTWLISILKRKIIDHYRKINSKKGKAEVRMNFASSDEGESNWLETRVSDPFASNAENKLENNELGVAIHECLEKLPEKQRSIFKMKTINGFDTEAICNKFGITSSNLWVIIHRARTSMATCMQDNWF